MKRISYYLTTLCSLLALAFTPGCTDDIDLPVPAREEIPEGITLRIPDPGMAASLTRSEAELTDAEKTISSLYLIAFPSTTDDDRSPIIEDLLTSDKVTDGGGYTHDGQTGTGISDVTTSSTGYHSYTVTDLFKDSDGKLMTGNWTIYVAANVDPYLTDFTSLSAANPATEAALKALKLSFVDGDSNRMYTYGPSMGLPMVCLANDIIIRDGKTDESKPGGTLNVTNSAQSIIHADMQFLVAKVRCTFLFDNTDFSKNVFDGKSLVVTGASVKNNYQSPYTLDGTLNSKSTIPTTPWSIRHDDQTKKYLECEYPAEGSFPYFSSTIPDGKDTYTFVDLKKLEFTATSPYNPRAYQVTMYLPANPQETQTELVFVAQEQHKEGSNIKAGVDITYSIPLVPTTPSTRLEAGKAYDIVAKVTGVEKVNTMVQVQSFTPKSLVYKLIPARYLKVDQTVVDMIAGTSAEIGYDTNAETVEVKGPTVEVDNKQVELYQLIRAANGKLYIGVNPEIPANYFGDINDELNTEAGKAKYKHFYIVAGDIRKKIEIKNLILRRFLTVDPSTPITIDARERIASGEYYGYIDIEIRTNLSEFELNTESWATLTNGKGDCLSLTNYSMSTTGTKLWAEGTNGKIIARKGEHYGNDGVMKLQLYFGNINKNDESFWSNSKQLLFTVRCDNPEGMDVTDEDYIGPREVTVNTLPNKDTYTIYFKANGWGAPHIYVYQCLELPMSMSTWAKNNGREDGKWKINNGSYLELSSYPVGYQITDNGTVKARRSALEYLFSGSSAFKGWDNTDTGSGNDANGRFSNKDALTVAQIAKGWIDAGFYMFCDANYENCSWNPNSTDNKHRYYSDIDFNHEHQKLVSCESCKYNNGNYPNTDGYPGIAMYLITNENDANYGWWKYELSGLATPGKALIMFCDGHDKDSGTRFPGANVNGLPLFNFPSRTGYIEIKNGTGTFSPTPSGSTTTSTGIWFKNEGNWENVYAYVWKSSDGKQYKNASWPGTQIYKDGSGNYFLDIEDPNYDRVIFNNGDKKGVEGVTQTGNLTLILGSTYSFDGESGGGGNDDGVSYRLYYPKNVGKLYLYKKNTTDHLFDGSENPSAIKSGDAGNYYYKDFSPKVNCSDTQELKCAVRVSGDDIDIPSLGNWTKSTINGKTVYCAVIDELNIGHNLDLHIMGEIAGMSWGPNNGKKMDLVDGVYTITLSVTNGNTFSFSRKLGSDWNNIVNKNNENERYGSTSDGTEVNYSNGNDVSIYNGTKISACKSFKITKDGSYKIELDIWNKKLRVTSAPENIRRKTRSIRR